MSSIKYKVLGIKGVLFAFFILTTYYLLLTASVSAHMIGQPPFFKVDGKFSPYYPVPTTSLQDFPLPQDYSPTNFVAGETINFEMDETQLPAPKEVIEKTKFTWEYGDGGNATGLKNSYAYKKPGSYTLKINADDNSGVGPQLLQSIFIDIVPSKDYNLPKSVISVNDWTSKDPLTDILQDKFDKDFSFEGSKSSGGSAKITEYFWDFGDGSSATGPKVTHRYTTNPYTVFPVLRIKTTDGFIADSFVQIKDSPNLGVNSNTTNNQTSSKIVKQSNVMPYLLTGVGILVLIAIVWVILRKKRQRK